MAEPVQKRADERGGVPAAGQAPPAGSAFAPSDLDACLDNKHYRVEYQPKISLLGAADSQFGVEALCRITDPRLGVVSPDKFIPMAETCGLIAKVTDAVVCEAFGAWRTWHAAGLDLRLALNVSPALLGDEAWATRFLERCAEFKMDPKWVTLEITETAAGATNAKACEILTRLQKKGFKLSIDDFGTGFSSLATLYKLPISEMKIDKSFIFDLQGNGGARELVESAIAMAKRMGIKVVAEGVETESVFQELRRLGCDEVQGYFVGKSMPADRIVGFFTEWKSARPEQGAKGLPKIAIVQALLNELAGDLTAPVSAAPAGPYAPAPYGKPAAPSATGGSGDGARALARKIPPLVLEGRPVPALALCHNVIEQFGKMPGSENVRTKLDHLRQRLEEELVTSAPLEIRASQGRYRLLRGNSVSLGRALSSAKADIAVKCRWFGPADKNLRLTRDSGQYFLEDLGSTHGHMVDGVRLGIKRPMEIPFGRTPIEIRLASGAIAPLSLLLQRNSSDPDALMVSFDYDVRQLRSDLGEKEWNEFKGDLACTWIMFADQFHIGRSSDCAVVLADCHTPIAAAVTFENGYWIAPLGGAALKAGDTQFHNRLPLIADCDWTLAGAPLTTVPVEAPAAATGAPAAVRF
jgi:EAL domain-containing protein (putative c-di-GMP-specific phosphodiesterase class I)